MYRGNIEEDWTKMIRQKEEGTERNNGKMEVWKEGRVIKRKTGQKTDKKKWAELRSD